jgi:radical SAM superfamily enzyme YgiQ (UPF0313 family)
VGETLRQPGAILLIACYELGHQPLGLAAPLGFLEDAGFAPAALDIAVQPFNTAKIARARVVGISVPMHTDLRLGVRVAQRIREINPTCHVCFYGLYASLNAEYLLQHVADSVIGGEFERPLVALIEALEAGRPGAIAGVSQRGQLTGPVLQRQPPQVPSRRGLPPLDKYAKLAYAGDLMLVGYVEASRGCKHLCRHCPIPPVYGGRFFVVPQEVILEDVRHLVRSGAQHLTFGDPDFLNGPGHALRVARAVHAEFPSLTFDVTAKIEHLLKHGAILPELRDLGCVFVVSAVESFSDIVLTHLHKGHTRAEVFEALALMRSVGITLRPSLVAFTPWMTLDDYVELFDIVATEGLVDHIDAVQYTMRLLIPPGSLLLETPAMQPFLGPLDQAAFTYRWTHPDARMDTLQQAATRLVEAATQQDEDPALTFDRLRSLATVARDGRPAPPLASALRPERQRPPRLTEPWFC